MHEMLSEKTIPDGELTEYRSLYAGLEVLYQKFLKRKEELRVLVEETAAHRKNAFEVLARANRLTRHLTGRQRQTSGLTYHLGELKARINRNTADGFHGGNGGPGKTDISGGDNTLPEIRVPEFRAESLDRRELKREGLLLLNVIDLVRKRLLHFDLLEMRCREMILAIKKAVEAFCFEWNNIRRKIYPAGVFSFLRRFLRNRLGNTFFTSRDMEEVAALGRITGLVLNIADAPLI